MTLETWIAFALAPLALLSGRLSGAVRQPEARRGYSRVGSIMLMGAGRATAAMRRA